ncbi:SPX domain-containing protein [Cunninghamella echinulata]|nr:SPX domain-containing protein [Cunninghamella echinulata]
MKFAKQIETEATELPQDWRPYLIQYRSLKKSLHYVVEELEASGLSSQLLNPSTPKERLDMARFIYDLNGNDTNLDFNINSTTTATTTNPPLHPCIKIIVDNPSSLNEHIKIIDAIHYQQDDINNSFQYKINLKKDSEFFDLLLQELKQAVSLQEVEKNKFNKEIQELESQLVVAASPKKKDMNVWREIFKMFLESSLHSTQSKGQNYEKCKEKLSLLLNDIQKKKLDQKLSTKKSKMALKQFLALNRNLNIFQHFQLLNTTAMNKILKKHDKRSGLSAMEEFPSFVTKTNKSFFEEITINLFKLIEKNIISIVPQPDDYYCPVCYGIAWRPIRLECSHVFCVRCLIKAHRKRLYDCPICRQENAVLNADANNLDTALQDFLLLYFPKEIKEKRLDNQKETNQSSSTLLHSPIRYGNPSPTPSPSSSSSSQSCIIM